MGNITTQDTPSAYSSADTSNINSQGSETTNAYETTSESSTNISDMDTQDSEGTNIQEMASGSSSEYTSRNMDNVIISSASIIDTNIQGTVSTSSRDVCSMTTQEISSASTEMDTQEIVSATSSTTQHENPDAYSSLNLNTQESTRIYMQETSPSTAQGNIQETLITSSSTNYMNKREPAQGNVQETPITSSSANNTNKRELTQGNMQETPIASSSTNNINTEEITQGNMQETSSAKIMKIHQSASETPLENINLQASASALKNTDRSGIESASTSTNLQTNTEKLENNDNNSHQTEIEEKSFMNNTDRSGIESASTSTNLQTNTEKLENNVDNNYHKTEIEEKSFMNNTDKSGIESSSTSINRQTNTEKLENNEDNNSHKTEIEEKSNTLQHESNEQFKQELERKHEKWRQLIAEKRHEMMTLREELEKYKKENDELKHRTFNDDFENCKQENKELKMKLASVTENMQVNSHAERKMVDMSKELNKYKLETNELSKKTTQELEMVKEENAELKGDAKVLKEENEDLKLKVEKLKLELESNEEIISKNKELRISLAEMQGEVQSMNVELLNIENERFEYGKHIGALKDVVRVTKEMLAIREGQIEELKGKIKTIEELLASKEMKIMSDGLREEYEKQLRNIRNLRALYEERQRLDKKDKENLQEQLDEIKKQVDDEQKKNSELQERVIELEKDTSLKYDTITSLQSNLGLSKAECKELQAEINIINQLFSEILLGFKNTQEIDLDRLIKHLEENHDLLTNMATNEESNSTSAALPKLLLDLINQMNKQDEAVSSDNSVANQASNQLNSAEEIVETLPKVWKVLMELLSHQNPPLNDLFGPSQEPCYKLIETSKGAKLKLSVSQTFIRLKDLILEKKFLERETYRLKHLNTHLECRLQDQEKRLELVSGEVKNTWHVVDKMQRQHQQLHTHEKVLRYELQQKRQLLNELKTDLQYCREKWVEARAKNDTTHSQWKELRKEFADRKNKSADDNQSAESGYSDGKDSSEDERGYESDVSEGKHETDVETDDQKTDSVQINEKRQLVQNEDRLESVASTSLDVAANSRTLLGEEVIVGSEEVEMISINAEIASGEEIELTATTNEEEIVLTASNSLIINEEAASGGTDLRPTGRNSHIEAGTKRLENLLEAREIRLKKMEEIGSQLVSRVVGRDNGNTSSDPVVKTFNSDELKITATNSEASSANTLPEALEVRHGNHSHLDRIESTNEPHVEFKTSTNQTDDAENNPNTSTSKSETTQAGFAGVSESTLSGDSTSTDAASDIVEASLILDHEVQELFDEMCKFVEQGTDTEAGNQAEAEPEGTGQVLSAREERLHRLEEEFKEVTEFDVGDQNSPVLGEVKVNEDEHCLPVCSDDQFEKINEAPNPVEKCNSRSTQGATSSVTHEDNTVGVTEDILKSAATVGVVEDILKSTETEIPTKFTETIYTNTLILSNPGTIIGTISTPLPNDSIVNTDNKSSLRRSTKDSENLTTPTRSTEDGENLTSPRRSTEDGENLTSPRRSTKDGENLAAPRTSAKDGENLISPGRSTEDDENLTAPKRSTEDGEKLTSLRRSTGDDKNLTSPKRSTEDGENLTSSRRSTEDGENLTSPRRSTKDGENFTSPRSTEDSENLTSPRRSTEDGENLTSPRRSTEDGENLAAPRTLAKDGENLTSLRRSTEDDENLTAPKRSTEGGEKLTSLRRSTGDDKNLTAPKRSTEDGENFTSPKRLAEDGENLTSLRRSTENDENLAAPKILTDVGENLTSPRKSTEDGENLTTPKRSTDDGENLTTPRRSTEEILLRREERLKRLEAQSQLLLAKTRKTTQKSNVICEKLDELHGMYGNSSEETNSLNSAQEEAMTKSKNSRKVREEILMRREARLRKLDIQCKALLAKILKRTENKCFQGANNSNNESIFVIEKKSNVTEANDSKNASVVKIEKKFNVIEANDSNNASVIKIEKKFNSTEANDSNNTSMMKIEKKFDVTEANDSKNVSVKKIEKEINITEENDLKNASVVEIEKKFHVTEANDSNNASIIKIEKKFNVTGNSVTDNEPDPAVNTENKDSVKVLGIIEEAMVGGNQSSNAFFTIEDVRRACSDSLIKMKETQSSNLKRCSNNVFVEEGKESKQEVEEEAEIGVLFCDTQHESSNQKGKEDTEIGELFCDTQHEISNQKVKEDTKIGELFCDTQLIKTDVTNNIPEDNNGTSTKAETSSYKQGQTFSSFLAVSEDLTSNNCDVACMHVNDAIKDAQTSSNDFEDPLPIEAVKLECAKDVRISTLLKLSYEENLVQLEERCRGLLMKIRNPHGHQVSRRNEEITSELVIILPQLVQSIEDEIFALKTLYASFVDYDDEEKLDEASAVGFVGVSEELLDAREARFWKLGEQCWEIVNAVTVDGNKYFFKN